MSKALELFATPLDAETMDQEVVEAFKARLVTVSAHGHRANEDISLLRRGPTWKWRFRNVLGNLLGSL